MFNDRTTHLDLPLPHVSNRLSYDVARLREALNALDTLLGSDDLALDTIQEIVAAIKTAKTDITTAKTDITTLDRQISELIPLIYAGL